ncbi:MAG: serine/threonine protein kinase, partial [Akkermansiaceae bacterium]
MSQQEPNALNLASGTVIQGYRIESVLGKGGFAITYLATDLDLAKKVVLKELLPDGIATRIDGHTVVTQTPAQQDDFKWAVDSFLNEAKTLATFEHPNIVRVSRLFKENGTAYIVMPFIQGQTLKSIIKSSAPLPQARIVEMLLPLLKGLEVVHRSDVLHRDIKPDNIFITEEGVPVLIDFGAARQQV